DGLAVPRVPHPRDPLRPAQRAASVRVAGARHVAQAALRDGAAPGESPGDGVARAVPARRGDGSAVSGAAEEARIVVRLLTYNIREGGVGRAEQIAEVIRA